MTLHIKIPFDEVDSNIHERLQNLRVVYEDRIILNNNSDYEIFLTDTNSEEIKHFANYLNKIIKGLELYTKAPVAQG